MMNKIVTTLLAVAGLTISSLAMQPQQAHADDAAHVVCEIFTLGTDCQPFKAEPQPTPAPSSFTYSLQNVKVTATSNVHNYAFDVVPSDGNAAQPYSGTYTVSSKIAHEDYGKAHWDFGCPFDPWTYGTTLACTPPASLAGSSLAEPAGAQQLDKIDGGYATLAAALQKALAAAPVFHPATQTFGQSEIALASAAQSGATKPDLDAVAIAGHTTISNGDNDVYTATIRNNGSAANGNVEVVIGMSGSLQAWDSIAQTIGLSCTQGSGKDANTFTCEGGTLAAGQSTTLQFRAHAAAPGQGTIVVSLNSSRALDESDYSDDLAIYTVTVTK